MKTACGVLIQPIVVHRVCQLLWFRGPLTKNVEWAGKPAVNTENDSSDTLQPRSSFERWTQEHHDQSAAWRKSEIESAKETSTEFMDIIASQLLLKRENDSLREFATTAAHDIRTPLRHIYSALDIMHEENFDKNVVKQTHAMARNSAKRLETLTNGLLQLSVIKGQITHQNSIDLNVLLQDVVEMVQTDLSRENGTIQVEALPTIMADENLLTRLFLNLISNAIKYRNPDRLPKILVTIVESSPKLICIGVGDNGLGIDPKYAEKIFEPLVRLETKDSIEGSGLGLAICQRVAEAHNGSIQLDTTYNQGTRFLITLPSGVAQT
jgi:light-regulated signal transduction histidine kinase (bacteriophytochrome)